MHTQSPPPGPRGSISLLQSHLMIGAAAGVLMSLFSHGIVLAQSGTITGVVSEAGTGRPLPGATVVLVGSTIGTATNNEGVYVLEAPRGRHLLRASSIGFSDQTEEVRLEAGQTIEVHFQLEEDFLELDEVVVTALGVERRREALTFSVSQVRGEELVRTPAPNVLNSLQGKVAGVNITPSSGMPGASSAITIRGATAIDRNNAPLWVIDGIPVSSGDVGELKVDRVQGPDLPSRILDVNPNDIESVSVLKGASAAALYGVRAANGAILITTRKGRTATGNQVNVAYSTSLTADEVSVLPDLQTTYSQGTGGAYARTASTSWGPKLADLPGQIVNAMGEEVPAPRVPFDNVTPFFQTGLSYTNNLEVSGANQQGNFHLSGSHLTQTGIIPSSGMTRYTARVGGEYNVATWLRAGGSVSYARSNIDQIGGGSYLSNPLFTLYWAPRSFDLWGLPTHFPGQPLQQVNYRGVMDNPRWSVSNNSWKDDTHRFIGNVFFTAIPTERVNVTYRIGSDQFNNHRKQVLELGSGQTFGRGAVPAGGQIVERTVFNNEITSLLTASYERDLTRGLAGSLLVGNEINYNYLRDSELTGDGLAVGGFANLANAAGLTASDEVFEDMTVGAFADLQINYRNMILANATARNDWASTMPRQNRSFFYPSVGGAFVVSEALNLSRRGLLNYAKLRGSIAKVGQSAPVHASEPVFLALPRPGSGFLTNDFAFPYRGITAFEQADVLLSGVRPQNTTSYEVGAELVLLRGSVGVDYAYFHSRNDDQIFQVPVSPTSGFATQLRNAGRLDTWGHELTLTATPVRTNTVEWQVDFTFAKIDSEVKELAEGVENIYLGGFVTPNVRAQAGLPYPIIFGSRYLRDAEDRVVVDADPDSPWFGYPMFDPENGPIGFSSPDWTGGLGSTVRVGPVQLYALVDVRQGGDMYAGNTRLQRLYGMDRETESREQPFVFDGVKGVITGFEEGGRPIVQTSGANDIEILRDETYWAVYIANLDEAHVFSTSFVRLREVRLSYDVPPRLLRGLNASRIQLSATGRNLLLATNYPNFDPETNLGGASNFIGLEYVNLPATRSFGLGLRVSF